MASAVSLNATAAIVNGHGLSPSPTLSSEISIYKAHTPIALLSNVYTNAGIDANVANVIIPVIETIGSGVSFGQFLLDIYPSNISPVCSTTVSYYGNSTTASTSSTILLVH
jgi:hypothetical protein